jgi:hypothetical protein
MRVAFQKEVAFWTEIAFWTEMVIQAKMASDLLLDLWVGLVEDNPYRCPSSESGDSSLCHFGKDDSRPCGSDEA